MDHESAVNDWQQNAAAHDEENYEFLRSTKYRDYGFYPDELAVELHGQAFQIVDCTRCANCCKKMDIIFGEDDIERIAAHLNMATAEFIETYLEADEEDSPYKAHQKPCPFLGEDDCCTIYDVRPTACREIHTRARRGSHSERLALPTTRWCVPPCSGLSSR